MQPRMCLALWAVSTHWWFMSSFLSTQILLCRAALKDFSQPVLISGIALTQVPHLALGPVELDEVLMGPLLEFLQVLLDGTLSFCSVTYTVQLWIIYKLAECAVDAIMCVISTYIKDYWSLISMSTLMIMAFEYLQKWIL